jgi:hypothetical protein
MENQVFHLCKRQAFNASFIAVSEPMPNPVRLGQGFAMEVNVPSESNALFQVYDVRAHLVRFIIDGLPRKGLFLGFCPCCMVEKNDAHA